MKNTITINGLSFTIEGCPVQLENIELTSEMSAQEIATSGGLIKQLVSELKPLIQEATKPVATPATTTAPAAVTTTSTSNHYNNNYKNSYNNYNRNNKNNKTYDNNYKNDNYKNSMRLQEAFEAIPKPAELTEAGCNLWIYETGSYYAGNRVKINVDNAKFGVVHINLLTANQSAHIHVYPDNKQFNGVSPETLIEFLKWTKIPENLQAYILKVATL